MKEIVLIEDSDADAELTQRSLKRAGVLNPERRLTNGAEAMSYLRSIGQAGGEGQAVPSIIFLDLKLPDMTGLEILESIRDGSVFSNTLKIVLSGIDDIKSIQKAYTFGANSFLTK